VGNLVLLPALLSGPSAVFGWSVLRIERKKRDRDDRRKVKADSGSDALPVPHALPGPAKHAAHA